MTKPRPWISPILHFPFTICLFSTQQGEAFAWLLLQNSHFRKLAVAYQVKYMSILRPSDSVSRNLPRGNENACPYKDLYKNAHSSCVHNNPKLETILMCNKTSTDKQIGCIYKLERWLFTQVFWASSPDAANGKRKVQFAWIITRVLCSPGHLRSFLQDILSPSASQFYTLFSQTSNTLLFPHPSSLSADNPAPYFTEKSETFQREAWPSPKTSSSTYQYHTSCLLFLPCTNGLDPWPGPTPLLAVQTPVLSTYLSVPPPC